MKTLGYYNGKYGTLEEMTVPFNDRGHFFGDGVYEVAMVRNYKLYAFDEHIERFYSSASQLDIKIPYTKDELRAILTEMIAKLDSPDQMAYWQVTRGTHMRLHTYPEDMCGNLWIMLKPSKLKDIYADVDAITEPDKRFYYCNIKTINLLPNVLYAQKAERLGAYDAILYREGGRVTECSHSNCHIINKDGALQTAPLDNLILPGIARAYLLKACRELGIDVVEKPFTVDEMMEANEVLISSTTGPLMSCKTVDGKPVGGKARETLKKLKDYIMNDYIEKTN